MTRIFLLLVMLMGWEAVPARADPLQDAVAVWLTGNDRDSLPALAALARRGDADARLLLARIETMDLGPSPYRLSLSPEQRLALFRAASAENEEAPSRFTKTWLAVEAGNGNPLAKALQRAALPQPDLRLIEQLAALGETQATDHPTRILALYGSAESRQALRRSPALQHDLRPYLSYLSQAPEPRGDGLAALRHIAPSAGPIQAEEDDSRGMAELLALGFGYGDASADNRWRAAVQDWLLAAPSSRPLADLCRSHCPGEAGQCSFALMALNGGYYELIRIDSPLERQISQQRFLASARARQMVLRRAVLARAETNLKWLGERQEIAPISHCAAELVATERQNYR